METIIERLDTERSDTERSDTTEKMSYYHDFIKNFLLETRIICREEQFEIAKLHNFEQCIQSITINRDDSIYEFTYNEFFIFKISRCQHKLRQSVKNHYHLIKCNHQIESFFRLSNDKDFFFIIYDKQFPHTMMDEIDEIYDDMRQYPKLYKEFRQAVRNKTGISYKKFSQLCSHTEYNYSSFNNYSFERDKEAFITHFINQFSKDIYNAN